MPIHDLRELEVPTGRADAPVGAGASRRRHLLAVLAAVAVVVVVAVAAIAVAATGAGSEQAPDAGKSVGRSSVTSTMRAALTAAEERLDAAAFSRQGLIDELSAQHGSTFDVQDATWAVGQLDVDWDQQAV